MEQNNFTGYRGEHLAANDLLKKGHLVCLSGAGFPFDLIAIINDKVYRIQVKATSQRKGSRNHELFFRIGKKNTGFDICAFVDVDTGIVGYLPVHLCRLNRNTFQKPGTPYHKRRKGKNLDDNTLEDAIRELASHSQKENPDYLVLKAVYGRNSSG
jgi:hypothetical protein